MAHSAFSRTMAIPALRSARKTALALLVLLLLLAAASACSRNKPGYKIFPEVSVNVGKIDPGWPSDMSKLSLAEQEMIRLRGRPEFIHVWYIPGVEMVDKMTIRRLDPKTNKQLSWVYLSRDEEIIFLDQVNFEIRPLSHRIKLICQVGDPQEIRRLPDAEGRLVEQFRYYNLGRIVTFIDGMQVREEYTAPLPHYLRK